MKLLAEVKKDEARDRLTEAAFIGFQLGAGGDKTFGEYLTSIGLKDSDTTMTAKDVAALKGLVK